MKRSTLVIVCGLPGSGKTTHAKTVATALDGVRFCPDEEMARQGISLWDEEVRAQIEALQWEEAKSLLSSGQVAIIEWGTWTREERDSLREEARALGAAVELHYLEANGDVLWQRVSARGAENPPIERDDIDRWFQLFEAPSQEEMARYDAIAIVDDPSAAVVAGYNQLASSWGDWADGVSRDLRAIYLDRLEARLSPGSDVLELGCGTGRPVAARLAPTHRYVGVDSSPRMVELARRNVPDGKFQVADMAAVYVPENSLDAVVAFYSIIHVPRQQQPDLFSRIRSWLRPGGHFVACLTSGDLPEGWEDNWLEGGPMYWSGFDADTNRSLLEEAGFRLDSSEVHAQLEGDTEVHFLWVDAHSALPEQSTN